MSYTDEILGRKIERLKQKIQNWAISKNIWEDSGFTSYLDYFDDEPKDFPVVLVLYSNGEMLNVFNCMDEENSLEFEALINETEFHYLSHNDHVVEFYPSDDELTKSFKDYFEWKWICQLLKPNYTELYEEVFQFIEKNPKRLHNLEHRQFEIFIHELFRNQGYETELGSGTGDGGVDVKIYKKDEIDQVVTLIQAKRYSERYPIKLEAVAALYAHVDDQKANRGLFITTSRYLPGVKDFANRQNKKLILATKEELQNWSKLTATKIIRDKSELVTDQFLIDLVDNVKKNRLWSQIIHTTINYGMITNDFCLIVKESKNAALIIRLPTKTIESFDSPYNFRGKEVPDLNNKIVENRVMGHVFRAKKSYDESRELYYWGQQNLYRVWDGKPKYFDLLD